MRPGSVVLAERLYLLAIGLMLASALVAWKPTARAYGVVMTAGVTAFTVGLYLLVTILTTRRAGRIARWVLVLLTALAAASLAWQVASGQLTAGAVGLLNLSQPVLMIVGAVLLFRPAARAWFAAAPEIAG